MSTEPIQVRASSHHGTGTATMIPDPFERTVRIPVQWIDGQWQLIGGGRMPELKLNVCAELFMPAIYLANEEERARWTAGESTRVTFVVLRKT